MQASSSRAWWARALVAPLLLAVACTDAQPEAPDAPLHGIVLVGIDTLRASSLSAYGNHRPTSPHIDALAEEGTLFEAVSSHAAWTLPGFVGLMTGSYPSPRTFHRKLKVSLVEPLRKAGFRTAAFTEGAWVSRQFGFDRGFDTYWEETGKIRLARQRAGHGLQKGEGGAAQTFSRARDWLAEHGHSPFFLFLHTYEVHMPYRQRDFVEDGPAHELGRTYERATSKRVIAGELEIGEEDVDYVRSLYDGGVRAVDDELGLVLEQLEALGVLERTLVVVTADHGEEMGGRIPHWLARHGHALYEPVLHVPLIVRDPRRAGGARIGQRVRLIDVMPTVLDLADLPVPEGTRGRSLVPLMDGDEGEDRVAYSELLEVRSGKVRRLALRVGDHKIIRNVDAAAPELPAVELYDLRRDPLELDNLAERFPELRDELLTRLRQERGALFRGTDAGLEVPDEISDDLRERLESLGYLDEP